MNSQMLGVLDGQRFSRHMTGEVSGDVVIQLAHYSSQPANTLLCVVVRWQGVQNMFGVLPRR